MTIGRLHVITDVTLQDRFGHAELALLATAGGADVVQFREKRPWSGSLRLSTAREMRERTAGSPTRLIINDHLDVAAACGADGVHLGRHDADPEAARARLGRGIIVGATANRLDEAVGLGARPVDYLGVGPVYRTRSKANLAPRLGIEGLRRIVAACGRPVIAIGGIDEERIAEVLETGAHGVAVLQTFVVAADPAAAVARLREALDCLGADA